MEYHLITEDSGSGLSFWKLLNSALFNDFTFTANRDYADMFSGCKFPAGFRIGGFSIKRLGKIICSFTSKIVL